MTDELVYFAAKKGLASKRLLKSDGVCPRHYGWRGAEALFDFAWWVWAICVMEDAGIDTHTQPFPWRPALEVQEFAVLVAAEEWFQGTNR